MVRYKNTKNKIYDKAKMSEYDMDKEKINDL